MATTTISVKEPERYKTTDFWAATYLFHHGYKPEIELRPTSRLRFFVFEKTDEVLRLVAEYGSADPVMVDLHLFIPSVRGMKSLMYDHDGIEKQES